MCVFMFMSTCVLPPNGPLHLPELHPLQGETAKDVSRWLADLRWRVMASEQEIKRRNEPERGQHVELSRLDETETAVHRPPQRVMGISVRYEERPEVEAALGDEI